MSDALFMYLAVYCRQDEWAYLWLKVKLEVGSGGSDPLAESLMTCWFHTRAKARTHLLLPGLILEQFGPFIRYAAIHSPPFCMLPLSS